MDAANALIVWNKRRREVQCIYVWLGLVVRVWGGGRERVEEEEDRGRRKEA